MTAWRPGPEQRRANFQHGREAEQQAVDYLQAHGLKLVARNYRAPCGEIDIIMQDGAMLVFVEVRYRANESFCRTEETIDPRKQQRLRATGEHYLQHHNTVAMEAGCRFDIIILTGPRDNMNCQWLTNAF